MDAERSRRRDGTSARWVKADDRYGGARPFKALYVSMYRIMTTNLSLKQHHLLGKRGEVAAVSVAHRPLADTVIIENVDDAFM